MEKRGLSLAQLQEVPEGSLVLLTGLPGAGKSTFCHQAVLNGLSMERPVVFVTTEHGPSEVTGLLKQRGVGELPPGALSFIDAFGETVGATTESRPDTLSANCEDLNSISMAIAKIQERIGKRDVLLAFDSLTSPYLFNEKEVFRFMRLCLAKFASEGNSVLALMDEGCGKEEDLGAMMSVADGILKMEAREHARTLNVVKHPRLETVEIDVPIEPKEPQTRPPIYWDADILAKFLKAYMLGGKPVRKETGDFVNLFWPNLIHWSCMLWDPKGFPTMLYDLNKYEVTSGRYSLSSYPLWSKLYFKSFNALQTLGLLPKSVSRVKDMKMLFKIMLLRTLNDERSGAIEYLEDISKTDEHYFRIHENSDCTGFENIGAAIASHVPPMLAGNCQISEKEEREWNAIETKCVGLGDSYCEIKVVPGEIDGLKSSLEMDSSLIERVHERLMQHLMGFLLQGKPVVNRPELGSDVHLHVVLHGMGFLNLVGERYRRAQMMGAARTARIIGERLLQAGLGEDEAISRVIGFMNHCKVGKVSSGETIRMTENCESLRTKLFGRIKEPSCYFTTGFLNGLFSAIKNKHVREIKCVAAGDPYCEWEII